MQAIIKKIGRKGEVVIPRNMRKQKGMEANSEIELVPTKNGILLVPLKKKFSDYAGLFGNNGVKNIKELDAITHELLGM